MEIGGVSREPIRVVAAAPSVTPWSVRRERTALQHGGVDAVFATVASLEDTGQAVTRIAQWLRVDADSAMPVRVAASVAEIRAAAAAGDTAVVLHFQGSEPLRARNLPDEVIKAVAASGGVIGLCAFPSFVSASPRPALDQLIDHAVHIAGLVGAAHVGLGLDFADEGAEEYDFYGYDERYYPRPPWTWPAGIEWLHQCKDIAPALQAGGFSPDEVAGIMGENFLRALSAIWGS